VKNTELVRFFLEMLAVIRLSHWATKSYSLHIATNTLYEELDKLVDEFVETLQGKLVSQRITSNRIRLIDEEISLTSIPESQDITDKVVAYIQRLHSLTDSLNSKTDSDLLTIRDDILKLLEHFLYMASMN
jgi:DNA-binding ferritin-like protein